MNGYTLDMASKTLNQYSRFSWNLVLNYAYIYIYSFTGNPFIYNE